MKKLFICLHIFFFSLSFSLPDYKDCSNTNELVWKRSFKVFVERFFENKKGTYNDEDALISNQILTALDGPPEDIIRLKHNVIMAQACQAGQASVIANVLFNSKTEKAIFSLIHYLDEHGIFDSSPRCTIFYKDQNIKKRYKKRVTKWAMRTMNNVIERNYFLFNNKPTRVAKKELRKIKKQTKSRINFILLS